MLWDRSRLVAGIRDFALLAFAYLLLPNLPVWVFEGKMGVFPHGYVNIECLIVGSIALFLPRLLTFLLLVFEICAAFVYLVCYTYQFSLSSFLASTHYLSLLPVGRLSLIAVAFSSIVVVSGVTAFAIPRPKGSTRAFAVIFLLFAACLSVGFDTVNGQNPAMARDSSDSMPRVTLSPLVELGLRGRMFRTVEAAANASRDLAMPSASAVGIRFLEQTPAAHSPNVVLVVVESWGLMLDPRLANLITSGYQDPAVAAKYKVAFGTAPFSGLTVPGEARELCHSQVGFGIMNLASRQESDCLPAIFHSLGYQDIAVHGYAGEMFQRDRWYKTIGFDQRWFAPDLERLGLAHCKGAFPGICDDEIANWINRSLLADTGSQPRFVYWLTLNSHLPVTEANLPPGTDVCASSSVLQDSAPLCSWFRLVLRVHRSIQSIAMESRDRPTVFILVGDHAPPFGAPQLRQLFSGTEVPYVILTPRDSKEIAISFGGY
jgi:phosphoglycerol transferase MdoB-like AlkP superfamily enzyme